MNFPEATVRPDGRGLKEALFGAFRFGGSGRLGVVGWFSLLLVWDFIDDAGRFSHHTGILECFGELWV